MTLIVLLLLISSFSDSSYANQPPLQVRPISESSNSSNQSPQSVIEQIKFLRQSGNILEAKILVINYLKKHPDDVDMLLFLGLIQLQEKNDIEAEKNLKKVLEISPNYVDARVALIRLDISKKQFNEASELIEQGLKQNQTVFIDLKKQLATAQIDSLKKLDTVSGESIKTATKATRRPDLLEQIKLLYKKQNFSQAKKLIFSQLNSKPNDYDALLFLGLIEYQQRNTIEAEKHFKEILSKKPDYMDARIALIHIKINNKQWHDASLLIAEGLRQEAKRTELLELKEKLFRDTKENPYPLLNTHESTVLNEIKELRNEKKPYLAREKAIIHLKSNPDDSDVRLILGLIYFQEKNYSDAVNELNHVLQQVPNYTDALVALIKIAIIKKDLNRAQKLLSKGLKTKLNDPQLLILKKQIAYLKATKKTRPRRITYEVLMLQKAKQFISQKKYAEAEFFLKGLVAQYPGKYEFCIALADFYLSRHRDLQALFVIRKGLHYSPSEYHLLVKKAEIEIVLRQYALAARSTYQSLIVSPSPHNDKKVKGLLSEIDEHSPRYRYGINEIGIYSDNAYVNDLHSIWDYSTIYYSRDTNYGRATAKLNYASRIQETGEQYELDFSPRLNRNVYADLTAAYGNKPALFPTYTVSAEPYVSVTKHVELSAGGRYSKIQNTFYRIWAGSLNIYPDKYWLSFRPYYFVPKASSPKTGQRGSTSILYTARLRRYFQTDDHYIGIGVGSGLSPDLADLLTVNFIVIRNNYVNAEYSIPILNYHVVMNLGVGYQRWVYPSGLIRNIYDGLAGFKYRF